MMKEELPVAIPRAPIDALTRPFVRFARMEASGGMVLLACTAAALLWANSPWEHIYHAIWHAQVSVGLGSFSLSESRHEWINDGLMSIFFFLVGLEIKREILVGELSSLRQAAFPMIAAFGGCVVPAGIYLLMNHHPDHMRGWAIPMATDIAFALGVLALLGNRIPLALKVFVAALAIVDDIFAVLVIAVFYTSEISFLSLGFAFVGVAASFLANRLGVRRPGVYAFFFLLVWFAVLQSGVHATIAGVLLAFTIPARSYLDREDFVADGHLLLDQIRQSPVNSAEEHDAVFTLEEHCKLVQSPLHRIEHALQPWVSFIIMPLFAFANAGVHVLGKVTASFTNTVTIGVALGLLVGKAAGVTAFAWIAAKLRLAAPPENISWRQLFGAACLCGIGFTMSLFIAGLAFGDSPLLDMSKIGTLTASLVAGIAGSWFLIRGGKPAGEKPAGA
jgi:NhaA family Na+:H+ antiporter